MTTYLFTLDSHECFGPFIDEQDAKTWAARTKHTSFQLSPYTSTLVLKPYTPRNLERINRLIALIKSPPPKTHFDMNVVLDQYGCGTVACIAGFNALLDRADQLYLETFDACNRLQASLNLDYDDAHDLMYVDNKSAYNARLEDISVDDAISTLELLRDKGRVDWTPVLERIRDKHLTEDHLAEDAALNEKLI